ncbi:hypothetical protein Q7P35_000543 [Cladosporium inversicolor]
MIHEVLLALSGHPSPLFDKNTAGENISHDGVPLLSPSEQALLQSIGRLSELHRELRSQLDAITLSHHSTVCRASANSIRQTHLARFQKKILDVESRILTKDASIVGAYEIVPLASVVGEFDVWHRRMGWYWDLTCFMRPVHSSQRGEECSGASLIGKLRAEAQTGFPDLEESATELSRIAETAWLRQVSSWIMHGKLPVHGADDFFIKSVGDSIDGGVARFRKDNNLSPKFVLPSTASSILFIGKSIHQVRHYDQQSQIHAKLQAPGVQYSQLANAHLKHLSSLSLPIVPAQMARAVSVIRRSLSQNILQHLLPLEDIMALLSCLRRYFLLEDGEFTLALVHEAEVRIQARWQSMGKLLQQDPIKALQGLVIKEAELNQTLGQTWKTLAMRDDTEQNPAFDFARKNTGLSLPRKTSSRPTTSDSMAAATPKVSSIAFNDTLFPSAADLILEITPPLDLFISKREVETYSAINAYLISVRRSHLRLADLWRRTPVRREHPAPPGPRSNATEAGRAAQAPARNRATKRAVAARKVWATCSAAMSLLSETAAYLEGEIIRCSWECFEAWLKEPADAADRAEDAQPDVDALPKTAQRDPETLAAGHRAFLAALTYALFLTDVSYTKELRSLLNNVDQLIALFIRLLDVQQRIDLDQDAGLKVAHIEEDERKIALELDRARKRVDSDLKSVINRLRQLDHERIGAGRYLDLSRVETGGFEPWKGGGVDRLLMKLEFGRARDDGYGYDII